MILIFRARRQAQLDQLWEKCETTRSYPGYQRVFARAAGCFRSAEGQTWQKPGTVHERLLVPRVTRNLKLSQILLHLKLICVSFLDTTVTYAERVLNSICLFYTLYIYIYILNVLFSLEMYVRMPNGPMNSKWKQKDMHLLQNYSLYMWP